MVSGTRHSRSAGQLSLFLCDISPANLRDSTSIPAEVSNLFAMSGPANAESTTTSSPTTAPLDNSEALSDDTYPYNSGEANVAMLVEAIDGGFIHGSAVN